MMNRNFWILIVFTFFVHISCKKDSAEPPSSQLKGKLVWQGKPLGFRSGSGPNIEVFVDIYQPGYARNASITCPVDQDGNYSALLFPGSYRLLVRRNIAPLNDTDSVSVELAGSIEKNIELTPFFYVNEPDYKLIGDSIIEATVKVDKVVSEKNLEKVGLYVSATNYCDIRTAGFAATGSGSELPASEIADPANVYLQTRLPSKVRQQKYFFVRVGAKTTNLAALNYSLVKKITIP